ncbi:MAG: ferredoxin family protein [Phycisphaeraceae bacterium]
MPHQGNPNLRVILYEGVGSQPLAGDTRFESMKQLLDRGYAVTRSTAEGTVSASDSRALMVFGRFDDASPFARTTSDTDVALHVHAIDDGHSAEDIFTTAEAAREKEQLAPATGPGTWKPWFPVIDYKRCTNCMQCLSFCLFDVYGVDEQKQIQVQNNSNCKTDCPACSRVCPEVAILFPKYRNGPINGDEISSEDVKREQMKVDISSLLGGNIYEALKVRSEKAKSRFSKERDEDKALKERMRCLTKLSTGLEGLDIPPEVFSSLPSMDQIKQKAAAAAAKAAAAKG